MSIGKIAFTLMREREIEVSSTHRSWHHESNAMNESIAAFGLSSSHLSAATAARWAEGIFSMPPIH